MHQMCQWNSLYILGALVNCGRKFFVSRGDNAIVSRATSVPSNQPDPRCDLAALMVRSPHEFERLLLGAGHVTMARAQKEKHYE